MHAGSGPTARLLGRRRPRVKSRTCLAAVIFSVRRKWKVKISLWKQMRLLTHPVRCRVIIRLRKRVVHSFVSIHSFIYLLIHSYIHTIIQLFTETRHCAIRRRRVSQAWAALLISVNFLRDSRDNRISPRWRECHSLGDSTRTVPMYHCDWGDIFLPATTKTSALYHR